VRLLADHYAGLPRGRVTRVHRVYLVQHGNDTPVAGGLETVEGRFGLAGRAVSHLFDGHERMLADDVDQVQRALGVGLGLRGV
jgi:hypothetical protein